MGPTYHLVLTPWGAMGGDQNQRWPQLSTQKFTSPCHAPKVGKTGKGKTHERGGQPSSQSRNKGKRGKDGSGGRPERARKGMGLTGTKFLLLEREAKKEVGGGGNKGSLLREHNHRGIMVGENPMGNTRTKTHFFNVAGKWGTPN